MGSSVKGFQNLFTLASRERCMVNLKKFRIPSSRAKIDPTASAAVLIPMCRVNDEPSLLYTVRSKNLNSHSGQVSFPGGKTDNNESPIETALRETKEEIGLCPSKIEIWGQGPQFPGKGNKIMITPVVGCIQDLSVNDLVINEEEVSEVFAVPLHVLCDAKNQFHTQFANGFVLPVFVAEQYKIWGLTAMVTHAFLSCLLTKDVYRNEWMKKRIALEEIDR